MNLLTSEQVVINNLLGDGEPIKGACLLDTHCILYGHSQWIMLTMQGAAVESHRERCPHGDFQLLTMTFESHGNYHVIFWTGELDDKRLVFQTVIDGQRTGALDIHSAMVMNRKRDLLYACADPNSSSVSIFKINRKAIDGNQVVLLINSFLFFRRPTISWCE